MVFYTVAASSCGRRQLDLDRISRYLLANGWTRAVSAEVADYVIIAACVSTAANVRASVDLLESVATSAKIIVTGCLNNEKLLPIVRSHPQVVGYFTPKQGLETLDHVLNLPICIREIPDISASVDSLTVRVQSGCLGRCSYCVARKSLGRTRSISIATAVQEIEEGINEAIETIRISGDDVGSYGTDIGLDIGDLLEAVNSVRAGRRLIVENLNIQHVVRHKSVFLALARDGALSHLQIPIQHTNERILRLMRRYHDVNVASQTLHRLWCEGCVSMETHFIVGFPTETRQEFVEAAGTCLRSLPFVKVGFYPYCDNEEAFSHSIEPHVPPEEQLERMDIAYDMGQQLGRSERRPLGDACGLYEVRVQKSALPEHSRENA